MQYTQVYCCLFLRLYSSVFSFFFFFLIKQRMIGGNESCTAGPISLSYLTCVAHLLGEWTGVEHLEDYLGYTVYLLWLLLPLAIAFIFPGIFFFVFIYSAVTILYIHKRKLNGEKSGNVWDGARKLLTTLWDGHARIWHGKQDLTSY